MRVSHVSANRLAAACGSAESVCIGMRPPATGARGPAAPFGTLLKWFDMDVLNNARPRRLRELHLHASAHVHWPPTRAWPAAARLHTLVLDVPCAWVLSRLRHLPALRELTICDCSGMELGALDAIALAEGLTRLVLGRVPTPLLRYTRRLLRWLPRCTEAHFHDCDETPCQSSFFDAA